MKEKERNIDPLFEEKFQEGDATRRKLSEVKRAKCIRKPEEPLCDDRIVVRLVNNTGG